ncbi:MAG: DNA-formamidopyrimidine glycosylase family protein [Thiobacillus sp.]
MPELPDVETFKRYLDATALHQPIGTVRVGAPSLLHGTTPQGLGRRLHGQALESTRRHGKYLFARVDEAGWLVLHFGMSGRLQYAEASGQLPQDAEFLLRFKNKAGLAYIAPPARRCALPPLWRTGGRGPGRRPDSLLLSPLPARLSVSATVASILQPGRNCWRIEPASRASVLVDGAAYFAAFRAAALRAEQSIFILGWDVDSRVRLARDATEDDLPVELGVLLNALVKRHRKLQIHVLDWDFAMLYAARRELLPLYTPDWRTHRRLHFHLDDHHPVGGSHHQKIVVIDDALAFVGGLDLTEGRWDTPAHRPDDPLRRRPDGAHDAPFHDVQLMVEGDAAAALGVLARQRWQRATGHTLPTGSPADSTALWPANIQPDLEAVEVAISRTEPAYANRPEVQEVKQLYLDAIAAARHCIYFENQYFTAHAVGDAMAQRLRNWLIRKNRGSGKGTDAREPT